LPPESGKKNQRENAAACWKILPGDLGKPHATPFGKTLTSLFIFSSPIKKTTVYR
jgi:hypothetical protein